MFLFLSLDLSFSRSSLVWMRRFPASRRRRRGRRGRRGRGRRRRRRRRPHTVTVIDMFCISGLPPIPGS